MLCVCGVLRPRYGRRDLLRARHILYVHGWACGIDSTWRLTPVESYSTSASAPLSPGQPLSCTHLTRNWPWLKFNQQKWGATKFNVVEALFLFLCIAWMGLIIPVGPMEAGPLHSFLSFFLTILVGRVRNSCCHEECFNDRMWRKCRRRHRHTFVAHILRRHFCQPILTVSSTSMSKRRQYRKNDYGKKWKDARAKSLHAWILICQSHFPSKKPHLSRSVWWRFGAFVAKSKSLKIEAAWGKVEKHSCGTSEQALIPALVRVHVPVCIGPASMST